MEHHIEWDGERLRLLDQRQLPADERYAYCATASEVAAAIEAMVVRGAPAIGIAAAYGVVLAARECAAQHQRVDLELLQPTLQLLAQARPTAVNLRWAIERLSAAVTNDDTARTLHQLESVARQIHADDIADNRRIGEHGATLLEQGAVITHCNAGALATGGYGTALGVIRSGLTQGRIERVLASETRPWLQGARLTAWELQREGTDVTLLCEGSVGSALREFRPQWAVVGADRIAANGDVVNKIGTYNLAVLAREHGVRMMVAAPTSTVDLRAPSGEAIEIELRDESEVLAAAGYRERPEHIDVWNPVFDVTPATLIDAIVTERGVLNPPFTEGLQRQMEQARPTEKSD